VRLARQAIGLGVSTLSLLAGFWLIAAPWLLGYQAGIASGWSGVTLTQFWTGIGVVVAAALTLWGYAAALVAEVRGRAEEEAAGLPAEAARGGVARPREAEATVGAAVSADAAEPGVAAAAGSMADGGVTPALGGAPLAPAGRAPADDARPAEEPQAARSDAADLAAGVDIERVLLPIATALLADLTRRQGTNAHEGTHGEESR
jgi:hypothetical protein